MTDKLKKEELLDYIKAEEGQARMALVTDKDEGEKKWWLKRVEAFQQIAAIITKFNEECVKSYKTGYKAGVVNESSRMIQSQPNLEQDTAQGQGKVTEEWTDEKAREAVGKMYYIPTNIKEADYNLKVAIAKDFIRSLVEELRGVSG